MMRSVALALVLSAATSASALAQTDQDFAKRLWAALERERLVGENATRTHPYEGTEPHGAILEYLERDVTVGERTARTIVKRNYGGEGASVDKIWADGREFLAAVTVMFQREQGYDPANRDWFWVKYGPDGAVEAAGKVDSCIQCHKDASGGDYIYSY